MKKILLLIILLFPMNVYANEAINISNSSEYILTDYKTDDLKDNSYDSFEVLHKNNRLFIKSNENIKYIYITYEFKSEEGKLVTPYEKKEIGDDDYLHEFIELKTPCDSLEFVYEDITYISEVRVYSEGDIPSDVQIWKKEKTTDLMLFSTHSDDEVLFFGGIIPTYINQGKKVHVVYLTRHDVCYNPIRIRLHEVLDGLWESGVRDYPTFGILPDEHSKINKNTTKEVDHILKRIKKQVKRDGLSDDKIINHYVNLIKKYKPKVILGHDEYGEYGHGQHIYNTYILKKAIKKVKPYYDVPKVYLHLYNIDNPTRINLDVPLDNYNNRTAYQVTKDAFKKHISQQQSKYPAWLNGEYNEYTSAEDITTYNPMYWGLYYTSVGEDIDKNDLFENIK